MNEDQAEDWNGASGREFIEQRERHEQMRGHPRGEPFFTIGFAEAAAVPGLRELPGPGAAFSLADTGRVGALLSSAGFGGIEFAKADEPMLIGSDVDDVLEYERASPNASEVLAVTPDTCRRSERHVPTSPVRGWCRG